MLLQPCSFKLLRGRRHPYIPCWNKECEAIFNQCNNTQDDTVMDALSSELLDTLGQKRRARWEEGVSKTDFTHSSRKAWSTINRLTGKSSTVKQCPVTANAIASILVNNGRWTNRSPAAKEHSRKLNSEIKELVATTAAKSDLSLPFSSEELTNSIKTLKNGKAPGPDRVHTEFLKNLGPIATLWLRCFLSNGLEKSITCWKNANAITILKPNKPTTDPKSYRPISLLFHIYKLLERMILTGITDVTEARLPHSQAGFRKGHSTTDQTIRLVHDIECSFQNKQKFGAVFIDLTAAYNTVWHRGVYLKFLKTIPDVKLVQFMMLF